MNNITSPTYIESLKLQHIFCEMCFQPFRPTSGFHLIFPTSGISAASLALVALEARVCFQASILFCVSHGHLKCLTECIFIEFFSNMKHIYNTLVYGFVIFGWYLGSLLVQVVSLSVFADQNVFNFYHEVQIEKVGTFEIPLEHRVLYCSWKMSTCSQDTFFNFHTPVYAT